MAVDTTQITAAIFDMGAAAGVVAMAWTVARWVMKGLHLIARTPQERAWDESRDWDDKSSSAGKWYD
jgi:hypothetical protein